MCQNDDFCVGTLSDNGVFTKTVDFSNAKAKLWLEPKPGANMFIGSDNMDTPTIFNKYNLNQCPVRVMAGSRAKVELECPCESSSGTCANSCYSYGA